MGGHTPPQDPFENRPTKHKFAPSGQIARGAEAGEEKSSEERNWLPRERSFGKFSRNITLPDAVDESSSEARYAAGVLYLTLKKKRASQIKRLTIH